MSAEFMSTQEIEPESQDKLVELVKSMSDKEFLGFYATILGVQSISRHSVPELQVRSFLEIPHDELTLIAQAAINLLRKDQ